MSSELASRVLFWINRHQLNKSSSQPVIETRMRHQVSHGICTFLDKQTWTSYAELGRWYHRLKQGRKRHWKLQMREKKTLSDPTTQLHKWDTPVVPYISSVKICTQNRIKIHPCSSDFSTIPSHSFWCSPDSRKQAPLRHEVTKRPSSLRERNPTFNCRQILKL